MICVAFFSKISQTSTLYYSTSCLVSLLSRHTDTILYISCTIQLYYTDSLVGWKISKVKMRIRSKISGRE